MIFSHHSLDYHAELGPCSLAASSSLFTVAGAILFTLDLASPPPSLRIFAFKACINFAHDVTSFRDPNKKTTLRKKVMLLEKGYEGPYTNKAVAQLHDEGREAQVLVFDASTIEGGGFAFEDMARIVSVLIRDIRRCSLLSPSCTTVLTSFLRLFSHQTTKYFRTRASSGRRPTRKRRRVSGPLLSWSSSSTSPPRQRQTRRRDPISGSPRSSKSPSSCTGRFLSLFKAYYLCQWLTHPSDCPIFQPVPAVGQCQVGRPYRTMSLPQNFLDTSLRTF